MLCFFDLVISRYQPDLWWIVSQLVNNWGYDSRNLILCLVNFINDREDKSTKVLSIDSSIWEETLSSKVKIVLKMAEILIWDISFCWESKVLERNCDCHHQFIYFSTKEKFGFELFRESLEMYNCTISLNSPHSKPFSLFDLVEGKAW